AAAIADGGHLPPHSVRVLGAGLAEALSAVHALGLVHRDVKPSNVLLTVDGPLLIDFGIARATDGTASLTSTGVSIGSPGYMSPEQILGKGITGAADVFSLGAVLAYAATGQSPFPGDSSAALLYKVVHEPPLLDGLEGDLRDLVERCLAKDAAARPGPDEIARTLAPEGAARLVSAGWLPGPLVEQVGRSAVQVLNLEAAADVPSGPVGFSSPSVAGGPTGDGPAASGVFGPPPVMSSQVSQASQASPASPETYVPGQRTEGVVADAAPPAPGKLSVSVAASSTAVANGRGRRVSCSVALAIAGVFALVGVGMLVGPGTLWGREDKGDAADKVPSAEASPSGSGQDTGAPGDATGELPKKYLGTWEGDGYALSGSLPAGTFTVTLEQTAVGGTLGTFRSVDLLGGTCDDKLVLKKVTEKNIVATSIADTKNNPGTCTRNTHEITLTPVGKELDYTSTNADAGRPTARLAKVE
ncbi:serine/threonine protein kinase, partial [Streptomyces scabiei]